MLPYIEALASFSILTAVWLMLLRPIFTYYRDPLKLRQFPSPSLIAAATPLWLIRATWSQKRSRILHDEFARLGDVIRVSPNHIIFRDPAAVKDIYGVLALSHGVAKDAFYDRVAGSAHDLVQVRDRKEHSDRRKALANAFAAKTVVNMECVIRRAFAQLLHRLDDSAEGAVDGEVRVVDLRQWLNFFTLDVIADMGFGRPMGFLDSMSDSVDAASHQGVHDHISSMISALHRGVRYSLTLGNVPSMIVVRAAKYILPRLPALAGILGSTCATDFETICAAKLRERISRGPPDRVSGDFMQFVLTDKVHSKDGADGAFDDAQFNSLVADSVMMMNAGSDTTAAALTSTIWFLLRSPSALKRLREELEPLLPQDVTSSHLSSSTIFAYEKTKDLPFLRACVDESLRLRSPIAYQLPRLVSKPVIIAGRTILPGTVVAVAPYSLHRHPSLFKDPEEFKPERWIDFDPDFPQQREHLKQYNIVFSQGSRACIGRHLAIVELQILIPTLVMRYEMKLAKPEQDLQVFERFNSNPGPLPITVRKKSGASRDPFTICNPESAIPTTQNFEGCIAD